MSEELKELVVNLYLLSVGVCLGSGFLLLMFAKSRKLVRTGAALLAFFLVTAAAPFVYMLLREIGR